MVDRTLATIRRPSPIEAELVVTSIKGEVVTVNVFPISFLTVRLLAYMAVDALTSWPVKEEWDAV